MDVTEVQQNRSIWQFNDDFVANIHNAMPEELCDYLIWYYEKSVEAGFDYGRPENGLDKKDTSVDLTYDRWLHEMHHIAGNERIMQQIHGFIKPHFDAYFTKYPVPDNFSIEGLKIQKTNPGEGYHIWHADGGGKPNTMEMQRAATFVYYLNDVEEGGETEFLFLNKRVKPVKNTGVWFPSCFTHTHRGNPPLTGTKYILTGWVLYVE